MARNNVVHQNFLGGEFSPRAYGRTELPQFQNGSELLQNWIVQQQGGITRRPGTAFVASTMGGLPSRLVEFVFSKTQAYVIEFQADPATTDGTPKILIRDANAPATTYSLVFYKSGYQAKNGVLTMPALPGPAWTQSELDEMQFAQSGDVIWCVQENHKPFNIVRRLKADGTYEFFGKDAFALGEGNSVLARDRDFPSSEAWRVPYLLPNTTPVTFAPGGDLFVDGTGTITSSEPFFLPSMVDTIVKITQTVNVAGVAHRYTGAAVITIVANTGSKEATAQTRVLDEFKNTSADADWELSAWNPAAGYPRTVELYEGRVYYYGSRSRKDKTWASQAGNFLRLDARGFSRLQKTSDTVPSFPAITNGSPYDFEPVGGQVNASSWLSAGKTLAMGSLGQEFIAQGPDQSLGMGLLNIRSVPETSHGSEYVKPARVSNTIHFVTRGGKTIRELVFDFNSDSFVASNVSVLSDHLLRAGIKQVVWQEAPSGVLWTRDSLGRISGFTRDRLLQVGAWHRHVLGGRLDPAGLGTYVDPAVTSMCVTPLADGQDRLWMVVNRTVNGVNKNYLEYFSKDFPDNRSRIETEECGFLDCHKFVNLTLSPAAVIGGFQHLAGETVRVVALFNGASSPALAGDYVVSGAGEITLKHPALKVIVGYPYRSRSLSLPAEMQSAVGPGSGMMKRLDKIAVRLSSSYGLFYGSKPEDLFEVNFADPGAPGDVQLFTGQRELEFPNGWDEEARVMFDTDLPFPCTITFYATRGVVNEV